MNRFAAALAAALAASLAASPALAGDRSGTFTGASGHEVRGQVEVTESDSGWQVRLGEDFYLDGAPDPRVGFGKDGSFAEATDFEVLRERTGAQVYAVPGGIDPAEFNEVYIWCRQFSVPLGVATIGE